MGKIQYPIQVNKINFGKCEPVREGWSCKTGTLVCVRPCGEKYQDKTYLGIYLGDIALSQIARYNKKTQELEVDLTMHNPAMFVPELNEIIYGCGSWWSSIEKKEDLKNITDDEINNVWYVKALKQIQELEEGVQHAEADSE